ncbi:MAG: hypothetical protein JWP87_985 [Labilithrix sp.]|nr:hypothetical protein [Labilithrix sp.]
METARQRRHGARATLVAVRRALAGLFFVVAFLTGALRVPAIGAPACAMGSAEAGESAPPERDPVIEERSELARVPAVRPSHGGKGGGAVRLRFASEPALRVGVRGASTWQLPDSEVTHRGSAGGAWRPRARTRSELMVFLN